MSDEPPVVMTRPISPGSQPAAATASVAQRMADFTWLAIASISEAVAKVMCHRNDADLKLERLARGFTAERVLGGAAANDNAPRGSYLGAMRSAPSRRMTSPLR